MGEPIVNQLLRRPRIPSPEPEGLLEGIQAKIEDKLKQVAKGMENLYEAVVEPDGRIRLKTSVHLENGLKVLVAVPRPQADSVVSGLALSEPSLSNDWLNPEEDEAWAHLQ